MSPPKTDEERRFERVKGAEAKVLARSISSIEGISASEDKGRRRLSDLRLFDVVNSVKKVAAWMLLAFFSAIGVIVVWNTARLVDSYTTQIVSDPSKIGPFLKQVFDYILVALGSLFIGNRLSK